MALGEVSGREEAQPAGSLQLAYAPSSSNVIPSVGIQVQKTQYFFLFKIDGLLMWQCYCHRGPLKENLRLMVKRRMHYFLRPSLKEFLEFCLNNFEVMFWTTMDNKTLEL